MATSDSKKICLLGARLGTGNMGVGALTMGCITIVRTTYPNADFYLLDYDEFKHDTFEEYQFNGQSYKLPIVNIRFSKNPLQPNHVGTLILLALLMRIFRAQWITKFVSSRNRWIHTLLTTDICLTIAGGDSFSDIYGFFRYLYIALPQVLCILLGKKLVQMPQTYGPFETRLVTAISSWILQRSTAIYSRDVASIEIVRTLTHGKKSTVQPSFCYDVAFTMEPYAPKNVASEFLLKLTAGPEKLIGLNVSGLLWMGGYTRNNMFNLKVSYKDLTYAIIDLFIAKLGCSVLLLPHVFSVGRSSEADTPVCKELSQELAPTYGNKLIFTDAHMNQNELKYCIGQTTFFIGARMHACIGALSQCIPAAGIAYSRKFAGVFSTIGMSDHVVDPTICTIETILNSLSALHEKRATTKLHLATQIPRVKKEVLGLLRTPALNAHVRQEH